MQLKIVKNAFILYTIVAQVNYANLPSTNNYLELLRMLHLLLLLARGLQTAWSLYS